MRKIIENSAWDGYKAIAGDRRLVKKLTELLDDIDRNPFTGIGKPEPLKGRPGQ